MNKKIPYTDYVTYTKENDTGLWFAKIKYHDQEEIEFDVSKPETIEVIEFILNNQTENNIPIGNHSFGTENLSYIGLEGITFQFSEDI